MEIRTYLHETLHLPPEMLEQPLVEAIEIRTLKKGEPLIRQGEAQEYVYILVSGILRGFFLDAGGQEVTDCFAFRGGTPALPGPDLTVPAPISIEAISDVTVLCIPTSVVVQAMEENMAFLKCAYGFLMASTKMHWELKLARYRYGASQRYQWFLETYPGLIHKVSNKHIASFLGMNPSTLSRPRSLLRDMIRRKREEEAEISCAGPPPAPDK